MAYIILKKIAFVEIPKVASQFVRLALQNTFSKEFVFLGEPHICLHQYQRLFPDINHGVCIFRDPRDRLVSAINFLYGLGVSGQPSRSQEYFLSDLKDSFDSSIASKRCHPGVICLYPQYSFVNADLPLNIFSLDRIDLACQHLGASFQDKKINESRAVFSWDDVSTVFNEEWVMRTYAIDFLIWHMVHSSKIGHFFSDSASGTIASVRASL